MFSFIGTSLRLRETVIFRKYVFLYSGMLEFCERARQSMSFSNNLFCRNHVFLNSCSKILKLSTLALIVSMVYTELLIVDNLHEYTTNQIKLNNKTLRNSTLLELGMGPEYSSDIAGDGPRKRTFDEDDYNPELERVKKKRIHNSKRSRSVIKTYNDKISKTVRKAYNDKRSKTVIKAYNEKRSKTVRKAENAKRSQAVIKAYNDKRSKTDRKAENQRRPKKSSKSGKEYDTSSPFPPTAEQLRFIGRILENSVAALFAQQTPSPEISYAAVVAEQLRSYTQPIL
jgi:hypothetical protein